MDPVTEDMFGSVDMTRGCVDHQALASPRHAVAIGGRGGRGTVTTDEDGTEQEDDDSNNHHADSRINVSRHDLKM